MKFCANCNTPADDSATFCTVCGASFVPVAPNTVPNPGVYTQPVMNSFDYTAEFDAKDVAENKLYASLGYVLGFIGVIIALLANKESAFVQFHIKQALKISIVSTLVGIITAVLCWTFIVPFAGMILITALEVISYISFFDTLKGNAKEPAIIRSLNFLR